MLLTNVITINFKITRQLKKQENMTHKLEKKLRNGNKHRSDRDGGNSRQGFKTDIISIVAI